MFNSAQFNQIMFNSVLVVLYLDIPGGDPPVVAIWVPGNEPGDAAQTIGDDPSSVVWVPGNQT